jgi:hypothetical protein
MFIKRLHDSHQEKHKFRNWCSFFTLSEQSDTLRQFILWYSIIQKLMKKLFVECKSAMVNFFTLSLPQHVLCCGHFQLFIHFHSQYLSNWIAGTQALILQNWDHEGNALRNSCIRTHVYMRVAESKKSRNWWRVFSQTTIK